MHVIYKLKSVLKYDERKVRRKGIFHAPDFLLVPMNQHVHVEMLGVRIKAHMEAISSLFGLSIGVVIVFCLYCYVLTLYKKIAT